MARWAVLLLFRVVSATVLLCHHYHQSDGTCYVASKPMTKDNRCTQVHKTYPESKAECEKLDMTLAVIKSSQENEIVRKICGEQACHIGLIQRPNSAEWLWLNDAAFKGDYQNWYPGHPINRRPAGALPHMEGYTAAINCQYGFDGGWCDLKGTQATIGFVCQSAGSCSDNAGALDACELVADPIINTSVHMFPPATMCKIDDEDDDDDDDDDDFRIGTMVIVALVLFFGYVGYLSLCHGMGRRARKLLFKGKRGFCNILTLDYAVGFTTGIVWQLFGHSDLYVTLACLGVVTTVLLLWSTGMSFGNPDLGGAGRGCVDTILFLLMVFFTAVQMSSLSTFLGDHFSNLYPDLKHTINVNAIFALLFLSLCFSGIRGRPLLAGGIFYLCVFTGMLASQIVSIEMTDELEHSQGAVQGAMQTAREQYREASDVRGFKGSVGSKLYGEARTEIGGVAAHKDDPFLLVIRFAAIPLVGANTKYLHEQRLAVCVMVHHMLAHYVGFSVLRFPLSTPPLLAISLIYAYTIFLMRRRKRHLPPGLAHAKFIRLGFLREMALQGKVMQRSQELPKHAFGDPVKAAHLIIISHRWLDPLRCDACTEQNSFGVKLDELVSRLDAKFSPSAICRHSCQGWHSALFIGGWDVVVFFDFMSMAQRGVDTDGSIIQRTQIEDAMFNECIPNMGSLYSNFDVLALNNLPHSHKHLSYEGSGWCTCEFAVAMLGHQLHKYSHDVMLKIASETMDVDSKDVIMNRDVANKFMGNRREELRKKPFLHESDRLVAQNILESFLTKRLLVDYIRQGDVLQVKRLLETLDAGHLQATLDAPVDSHGNTLLHIAVQSRKPEVTEELLKVGAQSDLRNFRGDRPWQWFIFPRLSNKASWLVWRSKAIAVSKELTTVTCAITHDISNLSARMIGQVLAEASMDEDDQDEDDQMSTPTYNKMSL